MRLLNTSRARAIFVALILPGATLAVVHHLFLAQIVWLWVVFTGIGTAAALLLTWVIAGWTSETVGEVARRSPTPPYEKP